MELRDKVVSMSDSYSRCCILVFTVKLEIFVITYFKFTSELLNSREGTCAFLKPYLRIFLARTLKSRVIEYAKIKFSQTFPKLVLTSLHQENMSV